MAYKINENCIGCGSCVDECPVGAITCDDVAVIDPAKCIDCGSCAGVCPVDAPQAE